MTNPQGKTPSDAGGGRRRTSGRWSAQQAREQAGDWSAIRDRVDPADVARRLMGAPHGRKGEGGKRLWWRCPFHPDNNPSFCIEPGRSHWRCFGCGEHGDALALVMKYQRLSFRQAIEFIASDLRHGAIATPSQSPKPKPKPKPADDPEAPRRRAAAIELVERSAERLWTPAGRPALDYLRDRGLSDKTIRLARLGWAPEVPPTRFRGVTIPWFGRDGLERVNIRQAKGVEPRYAEVYRRRPTIYPGPPLAILPHHGSVVVVEGEFEALLLGQELAGLATVITTGSASIRPDARTIRDVEWARKLFLAHDADEAGDGATSLWPKRGRRRALPKRRGDPTRTYKDWTEAHQDGVNLRWWWLPHMLVSVPYDADPHDLEERAAIMEHDGGLTREAAEEAAARQSSFWLEGRSGSPA